MATQGIVSVVKNGETIAKAVGQADGMHAHELADEIMSRGLQTAGEILAAARKVEFGGEYLVVQDAERDLMEFDDEDLNPRYRERFPTRLLFSRLKFLPATFRFEGCSLQS